MADSKHSPPPANPNPDWQDRDIRLTPLVYSLILILVIIAATMVGMGILFKSYSSRLQASDVPVSPLAVERTIPEGVPLLQVAPLAELAEHTAAEDRLLLEYGWTDQELGIARIPVARAMELVAEQGLPTREQH